MTTEQSESRATGAVRTTVGVVLFIAWGVLAFLWVYDAIYNLAHTYVLPIALWLTGDLLANPTLTQIALIWAAHIAFDRLLGFGLKYPTDFKDTHLNRI